MSLKITRVRPGVYRTDLHGRDVYINGSDGSNWQAVPIDDTLTVLASGKTKREVISRLEILARQPQDRTVSDSLRLFRRGEIVKGTKLTLFPRSVPNLRGKVDFVEYTRKTDGSEWIEVEDSDGRHRYVRPEVIKTVHRKR